MTAVKPPPRVSQFDSNGSLAQHAEHGGANASIHDGGSKTLATIALIIACILPSLALGALGAYCLLAPAITAAKIESAVAPIKAEANEAKVNSRVVMTEWKTLCATLKAQGAKNVECH